MDEIGRRARLNYKEIPEQANQMVGHGEEVDRELAVVHIILSVCLVSLVVVDELNDMKQVVLVELGESIGHLLKVVTGLSLLSIVGLASLGDLGVVIAGDGASLAQDLQQSLRRVLNLDGLNRLVAGLLEVQIVVDGALGLLGGVHVDGHLKLAPSLILTSVGRLRECCGETSVKDQAHSQGFRFGDVLWLGFSKEG